MNVQIYSREEIESIIAGGNFPENTAVISFCDRGIEPCKRVDYGGVCERVMYIELDDLELDDLFEEGYSYDTFFPEADEATEFIIETFAGGMNIICQCEYGQSRSAGCAAAILEYYFHTGISIFAESKYYPNKLVYYKIYGALKKHEKRAEPDDFEIAECVKLLKYNGSNENVVIPNRVNVIGETAFAGSKIRSVKIPFSVREIDDCAFFNCSSQERINIPSSVTKICETAFYGCEKLEFIEIPPDVYIDRDIFCGTKWARNFPDDYIVVNGVLIRYKGEQSNVVIPNNVKEIGFEAFAFSEDLKEIVIPKTVTKIGAYAFSNCESLELVTIQNPNTEPGDRSFCDCPNIKRIICDGKSVLVDSAKDNADDFTKTVLEIMAFVRQRSEHI